MYGLIPQRNNYNFRTNDAFQGIVLVQKKKPKIKVEILSQYANDIKSWLGPFYKTSGLKCTPKFVVNSYLRYSGDDFKMQGMCI